MCVDRSINTKEIHKIYIFINRPGVDGAVLQTPPWLINSFIEWFLSQNIFYTISNTKPEELESWNFERIFIPHYVSCVMLHMSCVTCHLSCVKCHVSPVTCPNIYIFFFCFTLIFFWQSGGASWWRVCYQQGLPRLIL